MRSWKRYLFSIWRWSWLVTLPVTVAFVYWLLVTAKRYSQFGIRFVSDPFPATLLNIGRMELGHLTQYLKRMSIDRAKIPENTLRTVDVFLEASTERKMNRNLPHSGKEYEKARLLYPDGSLRRVKIKYRGDYAQHWGHYKKSTRIKTKKKSLYQGLRSFNINAPKFEEMLNNHLAYELARQLGLLAPHSEMVFYRVNGRNRGIHLLVEQIEELTLRRSFRMPGDIYAGELVGQDRYRGASASVFENPGLWEKVATNNHYDAGSSEPLKSLTAALAQDASPVARETLFTLLDMEVWGRFALFELLTQSFHFDQGHNWRLYFDPAKSRFEPIIWDPVGWHPSWRPKPGEGPNLDILVSDLHRALAADPRFLVARFQAIRRFFEAGEDQVFLEKAREQIDSMKRAVEADPYITSHFNFYTPEEAEAALEDLYTNILETFKGIRGGYLETEGELHTQILGQDRLALEISGRRPLTRLALVFSRPLLQRIRGELHYWSGENQRVLDISDFLMQQANRLTVDVALPARHLPVKEGTNPLKENVLRPEPGYYEIHLRELPEDALILEVGADADGFRVTAVEEPLERTAFPSGWSIVPDLPERPPLVWSGAVEIVETRTVEENLVLEPGTVVRMAPGASLLLTGRLTVQGTAADPVRFESQVEGEPPWGALILKGPGADGSSLKYCRFRGGSGWKGPFFEYSAMFSVHDVRDVSVTHCLFENGKLVDDMVHAVYAEIDFFDCAFENALFDAVDLDISKATLVGCRIENSGNDGLDLMSSQAMVRGCVFSSNRDKGISVGEGTHLLAVGNRFDRNEIGLQVKDGSSAYVFNADFTGNKKAIDAYKKNWRYGSGGVLRVGKSFFSGNRAPISADKQSQIALFDTYLENQNKAGPVLLFSVDALVPRRAAVPERIFSEPIEDLPNAFFASGWQAVDPKVRGCHGIADQASL